MNIFMTGATGYIGSVVAEKLKAAGYTVSALARSEGSASRLKDKGYEVIKGDLSNAEALAAGAAAADGAIHLAQMRFDPDESFMAQMKRSSQLQVTAVNTILESLGETGKPFIITGGTGAYRDTGKVVVDEDTPVKVPPMVAGLANAEESVLTSDAVRGMVVRPGIVFGRGGGPVLQVLAQSKAKGKVKRSGKGDNPLSFIHVEDVADLYLLMLDKVEKGTLLNAVAEPFLTQNQVLQAISHSLGFGGEVEHKGKLLETLGMLIGRGSYNIFGNTMRVSAARARALGWQPRSATALIEELKKPARVV